MKSDKAYIEDAISELRDMASDLSCNCEPFTDSKDCPHDGLLQDRIYLVIEKLELITGLKPVEKKD